MPGWSNGGSTPFHWCRVDQLDSRRDMVFGAWGPQTLRIFRSQRSSATSSGMPWARNDSLLIRVPHVMGNELQDEFRICRPREWAPGRGLAPSFEISEIGGEGAERVRPHPCISEVLQGGDIGVGQNFRIAISCRHRQHGRQCIELLCAPDLRCRTGQRCLPHVKIVLLAGLWSSPSDL
jgi:hypothetical protein